MAEIRSLEGTNIESIQKAFVNAFSDYSVPMALSVEQLAHMIERRGYRADLSFGAFEGNDVVGFVLNCLDHWSGKLTAYDTGTGVIKEYRRQGLATQIFDKLLPVLQKNNIEQYLLEVITTNTNAADLYLKTGFKVLRVLDSYVSPLDKIKINTGKINGDFSIREIEHADWENFQSFWEFQPAWQNSIDSIHRKLPYFKILGIFDGEILAGYGIVEPHTGDIPQMVISKTYRAKGLGTALFNRLMQYSKTGSIKMINIQADYTPFKKFAESLGIPLLGQQYEMVLEL